LLKVALNTIAIVFNPSSESLLFITKWAVFLCNILAETRYLFKWDDDDLFYFRSTRGVWFL
jgi:hypothetical protein